MIYSMPSPTLTTPDFIFPVYDDAPLVLRLIGDLRSHYPESRLICVTDGKIDDLALIEGCDVHSVELIQTSRRLKLPQFGGLWLERLLSAAIEHTDSPYIIRTEGDTRVWRRFEMLPEADIGGTLEHRYGFDFVCGGCVFFKRDSIIKILASGLLRDEEYCNNSKYSYERYGRHRYSDEAVSYLPVSCADLILGSVASRLKLAISGWGEVNIQFRDLEKLIDSNPYAATHPHHNV